MTDHVRREFYLIGDLLSVPQDKIDACLADLREWHSLAREVESLVPEGIRYRHEFVWIDDGVVGVTKAEVHVPGGCVLEVRADDAAQFSASVANAMLKAREATHD